MKKILIVEDDHGLVILVPEFFNKETFAFINDYSMENFELEQVVSLIKKEEPQIVLLDHSFSYFCNGLRVAKEISIMSPAIQPLVLSTSIFVLTNADLMSKYVQFGVRHFPSKDFLRIVNCVFGICDCKEKYF